MRLKEESKHRRGTMNPIHSDETANLEEYGIYARYRESTFENLAETMPATQKEAYERCRAYAENFAKHKKNGVGMILKGTVGTGKTSLAVAILREVVQRYGGGYFIPMVSLMDRLLSMSKGDRDEFERFEKRIRSTPLLVLDDLGAEHENSWVRTKIDAIITERHNRLLPVIITTNLKANEILEGYRERVYDRLKNSSIVVNFTGASMRKAPTRGEEP